MRAGSIPTLPSYLVGPQNGMVLWLDAAKQVGINDAGILSPCAFDAADWTKARCSVTANAATDPWGATTADSLVEDASLNTHPIQQATTNVVAGIPFTASIYAKAGARSWVILSVNGGAAGVSFNLSTGVVGSAFGAAVGTMLSVGSGWYLISVTHAVALLNSVVVIYPATADSTNNYQGDGVSNILIDGCSVSQPKVNLWVDQSGAGNNFAQAVAASQPLWLPNAINGRPSVLADGVDDFISTGAMNVAQPRLVALALKNRTYGTPGTHDILFSGLTASKGNIGSVIAAGYSISATAGLTYGAAVANNVYDITLQTWNGASSEIRTGGTSRATGDVGAGVQDGINLFSYLTGTRSVNSEVAELIMWSGLKGANDTRAIESYLMRKYAVPTS